MQAAESFIIVDNKPTECCRVPDFFYCGIEIGVNDPKRKSELCH